MATTPTRREAWEGISPDYDWRPVGPLPTVSSGSSGSGRLNHLSSSQFGEGIAGEATPIEAAPVAGAIEASLALV